MIDFYKIVVRTTEELTETDWSQYVEIFNITFEKEVSIPFLKKKYTLTPLGFSYYGILYFKDQVVGMFTTIPRTYTTENGNNEDIGLCCDAFITENHRKDEGSLREMALQVFETMGNNGVKRFISIPNKIAYPYWKYFVRWKDIGDLDYYIFPMRPSKLFKTSPFLDQPIEYFQKLVLYLGSKIYSRSRTAQRKEFKLLKDKNFIEQRFQQDYEIITLGANEWFSYKIYDEDGVITAYLVDSSPLNKKVIAKALHYIANNSVKEIDVILFVGIIDEVPFYFLKVPKNKEPRRQPFIGYSLDPDDKEFFNLDKWEVSLSNFDNR